MRVYAGRARERESFVWQAREQRDGINEGRGGVGIYCTVALRENTLLSCVKIFAVRFLSGTRQRASLPCVLYRAHGKEKNTR
jgi:hypothetical protein